MDKILKFASASVSDRGLSDKRPVNEDSFLEKPEHGIFAVADGVGGAQAGDFASQMAMETLAEAFANLPENFDAEQALRIAIQHANQSIFTMSNELAQLASMATTIVALHVSDNIATIAHVGDSRLYRILPDGTLQRETADHSIVEEEVRAGRLTPEQAAVHPSRNVISRALGAEDTVDIDTKTLMIEPGTMFLLCSDGITRHLDDRELERLFNDEMDPNVLVEQMKDICYSRGAEDNLTAIVVRIPSGLANTLERAEEIPASAATAETVSEEEDTIAAARSPFDSTITDEEAFAPATSPEPDYAQESADDDYLIEQEPAFEPVAAEDLSEKITIPATANGGEQAPVPVRYESYEEAAPAPKRGFVFPALLFILGAALGAGGFWAWQQANPSPQVPVLNETKSNNIPLTAFEELRREVDKSPERFLAANAASPQDAEDHYLLGRAQLLTGKYVEAKRQFQLAKERLPQVDPSNAKTLAAEIALGAVIADDPEAAAKFASEVASTNSATGVSSDANTNGNSNTGGIGNNASPIR